MKHFLYIILLCFLCLSVYSKAPVVELPADKAGNNKIFNVDSSKANSEAGKTDYSTVFELIISYFVLFIFIVSLIFSLISIKTLKNKLKYNIKDDDLSQNEIYTSATKIESAYYFFGFAISLLFILSYLLTL